MRTRAIILKKQPAGEYDQLVTCYTEEFGKVLAVAKSAMKPGSIQGMHLDIFNIVDFELVSGRATPIITGAQADESFPNLKNNLKTLAVAYFFAEAADKLFFEYQKDEALWSFLESLLTGLNENPNTKDFLKTKQLEFLEILGYKPNLAQCVFCSLPIVVGQLASYSSEQKGAICNDCFLGGQKGVAVKDSDPFTHTFLGSIFEGLAEKKLNSLSLIKSVVQ